MACKKKECRVTSSLDFLLTAPIVEAASQKTGLPLLQRRIFQAIPRFLPCSGTLEGSLYHLAMSKI